MPPKGAWMAALHAFNRGSKSWCIPKKNSKDWRSVRSLQRSAENRAARTGGSIEPILWKKSRPRQRPLSAKGNGPKRKPAKRQTAAEKAAKEAEDRAEMKELSRIQNQRDDDMYAHMLEPGYGSNYGKLPKGWRESDVASGQNGPPTGKGYSHPRPAFKSTATRKIALVSG
jgi:hypothetical protein